MSISRAFIYLIYNVFKKSILYKELGSLTIDFTLEDGK